MIPIEHLDWRTFLTASDSLAIKALDEYFSHFVAVEIKEEKGERVFQPQKCCGCGKDLTGFFGTWRWALTHGWGECSNCGWPSKGHHNVKDEAGEDILTLRNMIFQLHPEHVEHEKVEEAS